MCSANSPRIVLWLFNNNNNINIHVTEAGVKYRKIPILRPPLVLSKSGLKDHFWTVPKEIHWA